MIIDNIDSLLDIKTNKTFCILPWIHFHAWPDGKVFPCCMADSSKPVASTKDESIMHMMNSDAYKDMRLKMINNEKVDVCQRCYDLEIFGNWNMRKSQNTVRGPDNLHLVEKTNTDGSIDEFKLKYLDIRFSNVCNMKCRSCGPSCSSKWAQEHVDANGIDSLEERFGFRKIIISNNENNEFFEKLAPYLNDVEEVYFAGGEAVITPEHYEVLDHWLAHNKTDVRLTYTTNFSTFNYKKKNVLNYWKKFPNLEIYASLDAMGPLAEVMRKGTNWGEIERNIETLFCEVPHAKFNITPTLSIWNVYQFPKFFDYMVNKGYIDATRRFQVTPRFNIATSPWWCHVNLLPQFAKDDLIKMYTESLEKYESNFEIANGFKMMIGTIKSSSENRGALKEFFDYNNELDARRTEQLLEVAPELQEIYQWSQN